MRVTRSGSHRGRIAAGIAAALMGSLLTAPAASAQPVAAVPAAPTPSIPTPPVLKLPANAPKSSPFPAPPPSPPAHDVPLPASVLPPHSSTDPVVAAIAQAQVSGKRVEVVADRTETDTTFANPDATLTTEIAAGPLRVRRAGTWVPVDPTLAVTNGMVAPRAAQGNIQFSNGAATGGMELAGVSSAATHAGFGWLGPLPVPTLSGPTATYRDVVADGDLVVTATTTGFEVSLVLRRAPTTAPEIRLPLNLAGLTVAQDATGRLSLTGAAGAVVASSPASSMSSAARDAHSGEATQAMTVASTVENGPGGPVLVLRPDYKFLSDPATQYPVTVDPSSNLTSDLGTYVTAAYPTANNDTNVEVKLGKYDTPANTVDRSFVRFNDTAIKGTTVTSATLNLYETWSWSCTAATMNVQGAGALNPGATWNTQPAVSGPVYSASFYGGYSRCPGTAGWKTVDVTGLAQTWSSDGVASPETLALLAPDETNNYQWKRFSNVNTANAPYISVTYNTPTVPSAPQNVAAAPGNAAATIRWTAPAYLGSPPLSAYYIYNYVWQNNAWVYLSYNTCNAGCTSTTFTGLTNGSYYAANVYGWNAAYGLGAYAQATYTPAGPPSAPLNVAATAGNASTTLRWSAPTSNGGMASDFYLIDAVDLANNNLQFLNSVCGTCTNGNITGLTNGHVYAVYVWAHNALAGYGPYTLSNDIWTGAVDPMANAGQRSDFTQQSFYLTDRTTATVNVGTGNLQLAATDLVLPAVGGSLPLGRVFNSMAEAPGSSIWFSTNFGYTWRFNQAPDVRLVPGADGSVAYDSPSSNVATFAVNGSNFTTPAGLDATLIRNGDGSYTLTNHASAEKQIFGADGNLVYDIDRNGNTLTFAYPDGRRVMTITGTAGVSPANTATITYAGPAGRVSSIAQTADGTTRTVGYGYDATGVSLLNVTDPLLGVTTYGYDANDNVNSVTGPAPLSAVTKFTYDTNHRVTVVDRVIPGSPDAVTSYDYSVAGHTKVTDGDGHPAANYTLDASGRVTAAVDGKGQSTATNYTADAKVAMSQNGSGGQTTNTFGANTGESLTNSQGPTGAQVQATYNTAGFPYLPDKITGTTGNANLLTYSGPGNLAANTDPLHNAANLTYNTDGTVATATDPANGTNASVYTHNATHQLTTITPPTGNSLHPQSFTYDGFGSVKTVTSPSGITTTYGYDNLDRLRSVTHSDSSPGITYTYDAGGNPYQQVDATGTTTYTHDAANQLTAKTIPGGPTLTYGYDPAGNLTTAGGDGQPNATIYHYDKLNQVDQITEPTIPVRYDIFAYNADHQRTDTWDNTTSQVAYDGTGNNIVPPASFAVHIHTTFNTANQLTEIKTTRASSDATTVADLAYSYAIPNPTTCAGETAGLATSNRQTSTDLLAVKTTTYCYDAAGHLTQAATPGGPTYSYSYDADGNRTGDAAGPHTYNSANQLTDTGTTYGPNGNLTAGAGFSAIAYNSVNQTTTVTPPAGDLNLAYSGAGQGQRTTVGATTSTNGLLGIQTDTTTGAATYYQRDPQGALIAETTPSGAYYYAYDGQGSVIALIDTAGTQRAAYTYDPYGSTATATALNGALPVNPWRYTGGYLDPSGLYHLNARYYNPTLGSFTQQDTVATLGNPANGNRYTYTGGDPINSSDPSGYFSIGKFIEGSAKIIGGFSAGIAGAVTLPDCALVLPCFASVGGIVAGLGAVYSGYDDLKAASQQ